MEKSVAVAALAALAQETRLEIFRLLVQAGPHGIAAGHIAERLGLPAATLSFHLNQLKQAQLVQYRRESRSLIYSATYTTMSALMNYLSANCCERNTTCSIDTCNPASIHEGNSHEAPTSAHPC